MKHVKLLGLTIMAVLALGAVMSATASALPELLSWEGHANWTGANTGTENQTLETVKKETITCTKSTGAGTQSNDTTGTFHITFTSCKSSGIACNTEGDASGTILSLGTADYVDDHLSSNPNELGVAILFLPEEVNIKCTALVTLKVKGHILCLILTPLTSSTTHEFHCTQTAGKAASAKYLNDEGVEETAQALTQKNGGTFEESAELALGSLIFPVAVAFMNE